MNRFTLPLATVLLPTLVVLAICGCGNKETEIIEYDSIEGTAFILASPKSLCNILEWGHHSVGVYEVASIKGYPEMDPYYTYIGLSLESAWKPGSTATPFIRATGGAGPEGTTRHIESFTVGERVVAFLRAPEPMADAVFFPLTVEVIFHEINENKYSNGVLFGDDGIGLADLRSLVEANGFDPTEDDFCSQDVEPEPR